MRKPMITIFFIAVVSNSFSQDRIITRKGDEIHSRVIEVGVSEIRYNKEDNKDGPVYVIPKEEVFVIYFSNGSKEVFDYENNAGSLEKKHLNSFYVDLDAMSGPELKHISQVIQILEEKGYKQELDRGKSEFTLRFSITGNAAVKTQIVLIKDGKIVIEAFAKNPGFGTWIARDVAIQGLVNSACRKFETQLRLRN